MNFHWCPIKLKCFLYRPIEPIEFLWNQFLPSNGRIPNKINFYFSCVVCATKVMNGQKLKKEIGSFALESVSAMRAFFWLKLAKAFVQAYWMLISKYCAFSVAITWLIYLWSSILWIQWELGHMELIHFNI